MAVARAHGVVGADATLHSFVGHDLEGFKITVANVSGTAQDLSNEVGDGSNVLGNEVLPYATEKLLQTIMTRTTLQMYRFDASNGVIAVIVERNAAWTASTLQTAIRALGTITSVDGSTAIDVSGSTVVASDLDVD